MDGERSLQLACELELGFEARELVGEVEGCFPAIKSTFPRWRRGDILGGILARSSASAPTGRACSKDEGQRRG